MNFDFDDMNVFFHFKQLVGQNGLKYFSTSERTIFPYQITKSQSWWLLFIFDETHYPDLIIMEATIYQCKCTFRPWIAAKISVKLHNSKRDHQALTSAMLPVPSFREVMTHADH